MIQLRITDFTVGGGVASAVYAARCDQDGDGAGGRMQQRDRDGAMPPPPSSDFSVPREGDDPDGSLLFHGRPRVNPGGTIVFDSVRSGGLRVIPPSGGRLTGIRAEAPLLDGGIAERVGLVILVDGKVDGAVEIPLADILRARGSWMEVDVSVPAAAPIRVVLNDPEGAWPTGTWFTLWVRTSS
jgi:hypothetical protein